MSTTLLATTTRWTAAATCLAFVLWGAGCDGGDADHDAGASHSDAGGAHDEGAEAASDHAHVEGDEHGEAADFTAPQSYASAIGVIHEQLEKIESLIAANNLDSIHVEAAVIRDVANDLGQLALKGDSGVPREAVREINLAAKSLAGMFGAIDEAGDSGNLADAKTLYAQMVTLFESIEKFAPAH